MNMKRCLFALSSLLLIRNLICKGPPQAPSFNPGGKKQATRALFERAEQSAAKNYNHYIPPHQRSLLRVISWNLHYLRNLDNVAPTETQILALVKELDADIAIFQEVPLNRPPGFDKELEALGYKWRELAVSPSAWLGNMVASRYPIESARRLELGNSRVLLDVKVSVPKANDQPIHVLGTHLEVGNGKVRQDQAQKIVDYIKNNLGSETAFLLAGDFNAHWDSPEIQTLRDSTLSLNGKTAPMMHEAFRWLGWEAPQYTCWWGTTIDFVFLGSARMSPARILGAYVYHSAVSDHLPLIVEVHNDGTNFETKRTQTQTHRQEDGGGLWFGLTVFAFMIAVYSLAFCFFPTSSWERAYRPAEDMDG